MKTISIGVDFSRVPFGRYLTDSPVSGQRFREDFLTPALKDNQELVTVKLDDAEGYTSSFLDEAFGGLIRNGVISKYELSKRLKIETKDDDFKLYVSLIWKYIEEAKYKK